MANVIGFYRQGDTYGCFSNFYPVRFEVDGVRYVHSEQFIMYQKAKLFNDHETARAIIHTSNPARVKALGRRVSPYVDEEWVAKRKELVLPGIHAKFDQNYTIREILLGTGDSILAECSPSDCVWGIGLPVYSQKIYYPRMWEGTNLLGELLMEVRTQLREKYSS